MVPIRYWVGLPDVDPPVKPEHLHGALSRWFDGEEPLATVIADVGVPRPRHESIIKPYTISPLAEEPGRLGVLISVLTSDADACLWHGASTAGRVRLGRSLTRVEPPVVDESMSWAQLEASRAARAWRMEFVTPTTFRTGNRTSPLPSPTGILRTPSECWRAFSGRETRSYTPQDVTRLWASDLHLQSQRVPLRVGERSGPDERRGEREICAVTGSMVLRCDDARVAAIVGPLLRLAPFSGVGGFRGKGFGLVEVEEL